jgi:beta-carotene 3-hydroxylase
MVTGMMVNIMVVIAFFALMEGVAWFTHKYLMHGLLWRLHKDHHRKESAGFFEHNDFFFLIFAIPGIIFLLAGMRNGYNLFFWAGLGISLYGLAYFLVHDIFIHQRFRLFRKSNNRYLKGIRRAHKVHHKHLGKEEGECFGMLWVPFRYFRNRNSDSAV